MVVRSLGFPDLETPCSRATEPLCHGVGANPGIGGDLPAIIKMHNRPLQDLNFAASRNYCRFEKPRIAYVQFASQPFRDLLKLTAMIGGPGFLMGGLALSHLVALLEHEGMGPWALRSAALVFGIALGAASFVSAVFLVAATGGCFGILLLPLFFPGPFVAGGVGLALGCQIGIAGRGGG